MKDYSCVFTALPDVQEIWVTDDGHFHLHPTHGGEKISRDDVGEEKTAADKKPVKEVVALIDAALTEEEVNEIVGDDDRKTVKTAADKKIASFTE